MGALDIKVQAGTPVTVNAEYHNELVDRLAAKGKAQVIRISQSASRVLVSHVDDGCLPPTVAVGDETDWRGLSYENCYIACGLSGVGELSATQIDPGGTTTWSWDDSEWASASLPSAVTVTMTPYFLTSATHHASVATVGSLPGGASAGDRCLVRDTRTVYEYNGSWSAVGGPTWAAGSPRSASFVLEQTFDPAYGASLHLHLMPEADYLRLVGGAAQFQTYDLSSFPDGAASIARTVVAEYLDTEGNVIGEDGLTVTGGDLADWSAAEDKSFAVEATVAGLIRLTATYDYALGGAQQVVVTRKIRVGSPERTWRSAEDTPYTPALTVTPGNGHTGFQLGTAVTLEAFADLGVVSIADRVPASSVLSRELASRLATASTTDPEMSRAFAAAATLRSLFQNGVGGRLNRFTMTLVAGTGTTRADLARIRAGHMVYLPSGAIKIEAVNRIGKAADGVTDALFVTGHGAFTGDVDETGWITSNAEMIAVSMTFAYGTPGASDFPLRQFTTDRLLAPITSLPQFDVALPHTVPNSISDGWYVKATVIAFWNGGEVVSDDAISSWVRAEEVPSGEPLLGVVRDGDTFTCQITGANYPFYGRLYWADASSVYSTVPAAADALTATVPLATNFSVALSPHQSGTQRVLVLDGHFRSAAGTCHPQLQRSVSPAFLPMGTKVIVATAEPGESDVTSTNGLFWKFGDKIWVSLDGAWHKILPTTDDHYTKDEVYSQEEIDENHYTKEFTYSKLEITGLVHDRDHSLGIVQALAGTEITGDTLIEFTYNGKTYRLLAEEQVEE